MSIVTENSVLSQINSFEQVDRNVEKETPTKSNVGVNFFKDDFNKGFILNKSPQQTDFILEGFPRTNFLDKRGNVSLPYSDRDPFESSVNNNGAPLLKIHNKDNFLDKYYSRIKSSGDRLSIRQNNRFGFDQPFVIREVGNTLGFNGIESVPGFENNTIAQIIDFAGGLFDDIGGAVLGRSPNQLLGAGANSILRTGKFLISPEGAGFLLKQSVLTKRNAQSIRTDVRYGITNDSVKKIQNIKSYDPKSLASIPGVTRLSIYALDPELELKRYFDTVTSYISDLALSLSLPKPPKLIQLGDVSLKVPALGLASKLTLSKIKTKFKKPNFVKNVQGAVSNTVESIKRNVEDQADNIKTAAELLKNANNSLLDKRGLSKFDVNAFNNLGVDPVNMIPYGKREEAKYNGKDEETLDFIPFRFEDGDGNLIVFRAILSGITDTFSPEYSSERYVGRPDNVYVYQGTQREISFTFDVYPKSDQELVLLWEKMNYLAGLTYPDWTAQGFGGQSMIAPFCKLTIGDMYKNTYGYISNLSYTVQDTGTWETTWCKLPKYIQAACNFTYVGERLPAKNQKHYEAPWIQQSDYKLSLLSQLTDVSELKNKLANVSKLDSSTIKKFTKGL